METRTNTGVLSELLSVRGRRILDIGSGNGHLVRYLTRQGARVTGLECGAAQLEKARSFPPQSNEDYVEGFAQKLPFEVATFDTAIFFNSLHHVPATDMGIALEEAERVIKFDGMIYVAEPIAEGSMYRFSAPLDDEARVRAAALAAIQNADKQGLQVVRELSYTTYYHYENFETYREESIRIAPERRAAFDAMETTLRQGFERYGVPEEKGVRFEQPMRVNLLRKLGGA